MSTARSNENKTNLKSVPKRRASHEPTAGPPLLPFPFANRKATSHDDNDSTATMHRKSKSDGSLFDYVYPEPRRSVVVTFAPLPLGKAATGASPARRSRRGNGFRRDYSLGQIARCQSHMIIETSEKALESIDTLKRLDFAFVKRADGSYCYSILACRTLEPPVDANNSTPSSLEEHMVFVVCGKGSRVKLRKNQWAEFVRLVSTENLEPIRQRRNVLRLSSNTHCGDWDPPNVISFPSTRDDNISD